MFLALVVIYGLGLAAASAYGLYKGARVVVLACGIIAVGWLVSDLTTHRHGGWRHFQLGIFYADLGVLLALGLLSMTSRRRWLMAATACQLASVAIHLSFALDNGLWFAAYAGALQTCAWLLLGTIIIGTILEPNLAGSRVKRTD